MEHRERFAALDGLRAVFGLGIVIYHVNGTFGSPFSGVLAPVYAYGGYFGNYFFFLLSGFLAERYKREDERGRPLLYLGRRLRRFYPLYALTNLAVMASGTEVLTLRRTWATFLMVSTGWFFPDGTPYNLPGWFLCVLMLCYGLYALPGKAGPALRRGLYGTLVIGGAVLEKLDLGVPFLYRVCGEGYLNFFLGVLLAEWLGDGTVLRENRGRAYGLLGGLLCAAAGLTARTGFSELPGDMRWWITLLCAGLMVAALMGGRAVWPLTLPGLTALGRCGLSLLLWHVPLARYWNRLAGGALDARVSFLLYLAAVVAVAFGSRRYLENIGNKRGTEK